MKHLILAAVILAASFTTADAQRRHPQMRGKIMNQQARISQGQRNGTLTHVEAMRLRRQQQLIRRDIRMARADGYISPRERNIIRKQQALAARNIYVQKHDRQFRR